MNHNLFTNEPGYIDRSPSSDLIATYDFRLPRSQLNYDEGVTYQCCQAHLEKGYGGSNVKV